MCQSYQPKPQAWHHGAKVCLVLLLSLLASRGLTAQQPTDTQSPPPTKWTSNKGVEVEAEFVSMTDDAVVLKMKRDGKETTVPLTALSIESIYQAVRLAHPQEFSKPIPKAEVKPEITFELPQLDLNVDEMLKTPFATETTIDQFFQTLDRLAQEGNFFGGWHALPPKMQTDIEDIVISGYQVLGPSTIKQIQILLNDLNTVARDKQQFILNLPQISANPQLVAQLEGSWPLVTTLLSALADEQHWQASNFQKGNVPRWLANLNIALAPPIMAGLDMVKSSLPEGAAVPTLSTSHNVVSQTATSAEVEVSVPGGQPVKTTFQKVGNIWINVQAMNQLRQALDTAKEKLAAGATQEVGLIRASLGSIIAAVGGLARANSQEEFNQAVELLHTIGGGLNQSLGLKASGSATAASGPNSGASRRGEP